MLQDYLDGAARVLKDGVGSKEPFQSALNVFTNGTQTPIREPISNQKFDAFVNRIKTAKSLRHSLALARRMDNTAR